MTAESLAQGKLIPESADLQTSPPEETSADLFIRLARDQSVSVEKIERLMALWERQEERKAETAFNAAMSAAQKKIKAAVKDENNEQTRSKYASYEALDAVSRPHYTDEGFGLSYDTADSPVEQNVRVLCYATHAGGHARTYHIDMPADGKGAKGGDVMTRTHATSSAVSYAMRNLLRMIFNIPVKDASDDDGNRAGGKVTPPEPDGFEPFWVSLTEAALKGQKSFDAVWEKGSGALKTYASNHRRDQMTMLKKTAAQVGRK